MDGLSGSDGATGRFPLMAAGEAPSAALLEYKADQSQGVIAYTSGGYESRPQGALSECRIGQRAAS